MTAIEYFGATGLSLYNPNAINRCVCSGKQLYRTTGMEIPKANKSFLFAEYIWMFTSSEIV